MQAVAQRLAETLRAEDTIARVGGDEFIVLVKEITEPQFAAKQVQLTCGMAWRDYSYTIQYNIIGKRAENYMNLLSIAQKLLSALADPLYVEGQEQNISASLGISIYPNDGQDLRSLMVNADAAMYHAKKMGRANYQFFTFEMNAAARARLELEKNLCHAIENDEFELHYRPKVTIASGEIASMEALIRWRHPEQGLISPSEFTPLAEEIGLIIPLRAWVLMTAYQQNKRWQQKGLPKLRVAVNLSAAQFKQHNLVEFVCQILEDTGLDVGCLELEITESVIMQNAEAAALTLERLHAKGVHISIDDFGTGYSSLSYLKRFPLDMLKIDRSFVRDIHADPDEAAIVQSVIALAHSLRLGVIAEGVETEEQLAFLKALDCDEYQVFYRSRPLPPAEFEKLLLASVEKMETALLSGTTI